MNRHVSSWFKQLFVLLLFMGGSIQMLSAQNQSVTVKLENATLKELFTVIERQTSYRFSYRNVVLDEKENVTVSMKDASVPQVLDRVFAKKISATILFPRNRL